MVTKFLKNLLANLINIDIKEETNNIKLRSILKIYVYLGVCIQLIVSVVELIDKNYIPAIVAFVYWLILLIFAFIGDKVNLEITNAVTTLTTMCYCVAMALFLGAGANYQAYFFLAIPLLIGNVEPNQLKKYILIGLASIIYLYCSVQFAFFDPYFEASYWTMLVIYVLNSVLVFFSMVLHTLLCDIYSDTTIDKLKEDKKMLDKDSKMDHLTGLYNRRSMERYLSTLEDQYHITNKPFGLILFDIDFFKKVNDTYGHQSGDRVLAEISRLIVYSLRKSDEVFRYGGEEILAVVTGVQTRDDLIKVADGIRQDIASLKIPCDEVDVSVTISAGATLFDGAEIDAVIKRVDEALYTAKNNGRNRVEFI